MARQTRAQRRARRERAGMGAAGEAALTGGPPTPPRRPTATAGGQPQPDRDRHPAPATERRIPGVQFIGESWAELKKVDWPNQNQIIQATVVVLIACTIVGVYLYGADLLLRRLVEQVFLK